MNARCSYRELVQRALFLSFLLSSPLLSSPLLSSLLLFFPLFSSPLLISPHRILTSRGFVTRVPPSVEHLSFSVFLLVSSRSENTIHRPRYVYIASEIPYLGKDAARWKRRIKPDVNGVIEFSRHPRSRVSDDVS